MTGSMSFAQITINANDIIGFGESIELTYDTIPTIAHAPAGTDQTWNYSGLLNSHTSENFGFGAPSWYPGSSEFPNATLASYEPVSNSTLFIDKTEDAMDILGVFGDLAGTGTNQSIVFDPYDRLITFPSTFGTEYFNTFELNFTIDGAAFSADSVVIQNTTDKTSIMDSWGTITTPFGTFEVIRQYVYEASTTIVDAYLFGGSVFNNTEVEETHTYVFWTNDGVSRYSVLEYTYDPASDLVLEVIWQSGAPILSLEEEGAAISSIKIYPNPASDLLTIESGLDGAFNVEIVDGLGRAVFFGEINESMNTLSVDELKNGIYTMRLTNINTQETSVKRFIVQH